LRKRCPKFIAFSAKPQKNFLGFSGEGTQFLVFGGKVVGEEEFFIYLF
jgi:hypothetical protein